MTYINYVNYFNKIHYHPLIFNSMLHKKNFYECYNKMYISTRIKKLCTLDDSSFFEKLMTYSGLVSEYMWSKKAKKKTILFFF